jgi:hypothetical protein
MMMDTLRAPSTFHGSAATELAGAEMAAVEKVLKRGTRRAWLHGAIDPALDWFVRPLVTLVPEFNANREPVGFANPNIIREESWKA